MLYSTDERAKSKMKPPNTTAYMAQPILNATTRYYQYPFFLKVKMKALTCTSAPLRHVCSNCTEADKGLQMLSCKASLLQYHFYYTLSCLEARCVCRQAAVKAAKILPLVGLARSKQDPINRGHGPQCLYRPPPAGANMVGRFTANPGQHANWPASVQNPSHPFYRSTYSFMRALLSKWAIPPLFPQAIRFL